MDPDSNTDIPRSNVDDSMTYLGIRMTPAQNNNDEYEYRKKQVTTFSNRLSHSSLTHEKSYIAYTNVFLPKIRYINSHITFTKTQWNVLQSILHETVLPKIGINRHFPSVVLYGDSRYGGIHFPHLNAMSLGKRLQSLICGFRTNS